MTRRALMISPGYTILDGYEDDVPRAVRTTPADTWSKGFGALLDRLAPQFDREGVVLLDGPAANALKLPTDPKSTATVGLDDARAAGWLHGKTGPWTKFYGEGRPTVVLGTMSWPDFYRSPVTYAASGMDTVYRLALWQDLTGSAWRGTPGVAGMTVLRETLPRLPMKGAKVQPSLKMTEGPGDDGWELPWYPDDFTRPQTTRYAHGYDVTRMYLASAQSCEVLAPWKLRHTGRRAFDPKLAGWWKVDLGPWNEDRIMAPAGPGDEKVRWLTTPRVALLHELQHAGGPFQNFEVLDSWTGPGKRLLRPWAETLEGAYQVARTLAEHTGDRSGRDQDAGAVMAAVKAAYSETLGLLKPNAGPDSGPTYRGDWHYSNIGGACSNLWRRMWQVGQTEDRWPLEVTVDHVWYGSDDPDPRSAKPDGIPLRNNHGAEDALGTFKPKGTRERGKA